MDYKSAIISDINHLNEDVFVIKCKGDFLGRPGQFYMLRINDFNHSDPLLARPISISDIQNGEITFLIQIMGRGTKVLSEKKVGDSLMILGPLGSSFNIIDKKCALLSGAAGIAPLLYLAKNMKVKPDLYAGFRTKPYYIEELKPYCDNIFIATEDGSYGYKGYALDLLEDNDYEKVYACGPMPMLIAAKNKIKTTDLEISLEAHMGCGIGACLSCTKPVEGYELFRICKEGPVVNARRLK